jgi:flagellar biosynthesis/type III secretory pathway chaperone
LSEPITKAIENKNQNLTIFTSPEQRIEEFKQYNKIAEEKTAITLLEKLLDKDLLEFITEYPSTQYTKEMTKLNTYVSAYMQVYNIIPYQNEKGEWVLEDEDLEQIKVMCTQFMLKMTSHKRRRSHEIVNGAARNDSSVAVLGENKGVKRFLGLR